MLSFIAFLFPSFSYFFSLILSGFLFVSCTSYFDYFIPSKKEIILALFNLLNQYKLLTFFNNLYLIFFYQKTKDFFFQTTFIYVGGFFYVLVSKFLFLNAASLYLYSKLFIFFIYLVLNFCLFLVYLRFLLNISIILHNLSHIYKYEPLSNTDNHLPSNTSQPIPPNRPTQNNYTLFSHSTHTHSHTHHEQAARNVSRFRLLGFGVAFATLFVGGYTAYQQQQQTYHTAREADCAAVEAKLITKEEYYKRHPHDRPSNYSSK